MVDVRVVGPDVERSGEVLTPEALEFVADLQTRFGAHRDALLAARATRRAEIAAEGRIGFRPETAEIRDGDWRVPRPRPAWWTAGWRSPARPSRRWPSTR